MLAAADPITDGRLSPSPTDLVSIIAEVTHYPKTLLELDADFENDLGIDSVKKGEIAVVIGQRFGLAQAQLEQFAGTTTIRALQEKVTSLVAAATRPARSGSQGNEPQRTQETDVLRRVTEVVARVTHYPLELLAPHAHFENDLGIDSVKLGEIGVELRSAFPPLAELPPPQTPIETLADLTRRVEEALRGRPAPASSSTLHENGRLKQVVAAEAPAQPFAGRVAFISGSGQGLGRVTAQELARRGAKVVVNSFHHREQGEDTVAQIRRDHGEALHAWGSVAHPEHVQRMFDEVRERYGKLDFFIHNASNGAFAQFRDATQDDYLKSFKTNVLGFRECALKAAELMRPRGGKILALSSVFSHAALDYFAVQGPIKASLETTVMYLAKELLPDNVQVNCLAFGPIVGRVLNLYPEHERVIGGLKQRSQGQQLITEEEAALAQMLFLHSDAAPITGAIIRIDRGLFVSSWA